MSRRLELAHPVGAGPPTGQTGTGALLIVVFLVVCVLAFGCGMLIPMYH